MTPSIQTARAPAEAARPVRGHVRSEADKVRYATMPTSLGFVLVARSDK